MPAAVAGDHHQLVRRHRQFLREAVEHELDVLAIDHVVEAIRTHQKDISGHYRHELGAHHPLAAEPERLGHQMAVVARRELFGRDEPGIVGLLIGTVVTGQQLQAAVPEAIDTRIADVHHAGMIVIQEDTGECSAHAGLMAFGGSLAADPPAGPNDCLAEQFTCRRGIDGPPDKTVA